jgi:hypothetical protein
MRFNTWAGRLALFTILAAAIPALAEVPQAGDPLPLDPLVVRGLGKGSVPLGGQWSFRTGDNRVWASPDYDDSGWKSIDISRPWGDQGYFAHTGFAWYRHRIDFGDADKVAIFVPEASGTYELFWNGVRVGGFGPLPGRPSAYSMPPALYQLSRPGSGIMAFRVWTHPNDTSNPGDILGLAATPLATNPEAGANLLRLDRYEMIRTNLASFSLIPFYAGLGIVGALVWFRNRNQKLIFWMTLYCFSLLLFIGLNPGATVRAVFQLSPIFLSSPFHTLNDVALWYLLIHLLGLNRHRWVLRLARILAIVALLSAFGDDWIFSILWGSTHVLAFQILDAILTAGFSIPELFPLLLVGMAIGRGRLGSSRWLVAIAAAANEMWFVTWHTADQGSRFTHFTLGQKMTSLSFTVFGIPILVQEILSTILILAIILAVYRYIMMEAGRQRIIREELKSAQELQRVLIPEALPRLPGFAITSAYQPAAEVGGDFFQLVAVNKNTSILVVGDVSGKGLKAAMTVSLIIGALRTLTDLTSQPDKILEMLNRRMMGRLQNGFVTCLVIRIGADGACMAASAGHPAPFVGDHEVYLAPALPLGLDQDAKYERHPFDLRVGARLTVYTDGLLEARSSDGELFGFKRLEKLISLRPDAKEAVDTAIEFGQEDDITVITVTRLDVGQRSSTSLQAPALEPVRS